MARKPVALSVLSLLALSAGLPACFLLGEVEDGPVPALNEVVMSPGMRITAVTPAGTITITAGKGLKRSYTWEGATRSVEMLPREKRW